MLDCIELVFKRLKEFNLKIKPKNAILTPVFYFWAMYYQLGEFQLTLKK